MINFDYHTHSTYCDGKNTLEEMAEGAVKKGVKGLGFSGHSHTPFDESYCMSRDKTLKYIDEAEGLKNKYSGKLDIFTGIEYDLFSDEENLSKFDYVIGSVHYALKDGKYLPVDESEDIFVENVGRRYGGDYYAFCEDYFKEVGSLADIGEVDIIGHFDLVTKFNEGDRLFNTRNKRYASAAESALIKLSAMNKILEINTGAVSRGYRMLPYPDECILSVWRDLGGKIIFSGDAHSIDGICYKFDLAEKTARKCGFSSAIELTDNGFIEINL